MSISVIFVTSPRFRTPGCRCAKTRFGKGSISATAAHSHPSGPQASLAASMPLNRERNLTMRLRQAAGTSSRSAPS